MFFGHCHRTRFRDGFCLASVFEMTVYLLTYLLTILGDHQNSFDPAVNKECSQPT